MAKHRRKVPKAVKATLVEQAGGKCANPGCFNRRTEIHHIKQWAVYGSNDEQHLIALCPACHDAAHHGRIRLDDAVLYSWKELARPEISADLFGVEPGLKPIMYIGDSAIIARDGSATAINLGENANLRFRLDKKNFFLVSLELSTLAGESVISIDDGRVTHSLDKCVTYERTAGALRIKALQPDRCVPGWLPDKVADFEKLFGKPAAEYFRPGFDLLNVRTIAPSQVRVSGLLCTPDCAVFAAKSGNIFFAGPSGCSSVSGSGTFNLPADGMFASFDGAHALFGLSELTKI